MTLVAPSILSCDFTRISDEIESLRTAGADWVHVDVMDGHFVDNLTIGPPVISKIRSVTKLPLDVHLMIENPEKSLDQYIKAGADLLTIHVEATKNVKTALKAIRDSGKKVGITLRPQTPIKTLLPFLELVDLALVMTVNPGWGGQSFLNDQVSKIQYLSKWAKANNPKLYIEVDGGLNPVTAKTCRDSGANVLVAGNAVFKAPNYKLAISELRG